VGSIPTVSTLTPVLAVQSQSRGYAAFRSGEGGMTVTVCQDKAGTDESSRRAAEWVKENISTDVSPPAITEGDTVLAF
jgi:hypothetical protein